MNEQLQDRVDEYILGRMTEEEMRKFEAEMYSDSALREQYAFTRCVRDELKDRNEKLAMFQDFEREGKRKKRTVYFVQALVGVAACLTIGLFLKPSAKSERILVSSMPNKNFNAPSYSVSDDVCFDSKKETSSSKRIALLADSVEQLLLKDRADVIRSTSFSNMGSDSDLTQEKVDLEQLLSAIEYLKNGEIDKAGQLLKPLVEHEGLYQKLAKKLYTAVTE